MTHSQELPITDELLLSYLEGNVSGKDVEAIESAIENSLELQSIVDAYLLMQDDIIKIDSNRMDIGVKVQNVPCLVEKQKSHLNRSVFHVYAAAAIVLTFVCGLGVKLLVDRAADQPMVNPSSDEVMPMAPMSVAPMSPACVDDTMSIHDNQDLNIKD